MFESVLPCALPFVRIRKHRFSDHAADLYGSFWSKMYVNTLAFVLRNGYFHKIESPKTKL